MGTAPLSNSWIISIIWLYIALNRTPTVDCYWVGAVPKVHPLRISRLIRINLGEIGPNIGIMDKKMETTIMSYIGIVGYILALYWDS